MMKQKAVLFHHTLCFLYICKNNAEKCISARNDLLTSIKNNDKQGTDKE